MVAATGGGKARGVTESAEVESNRDDVDRGVLERVAAGDVESFAVLVERHQDRLARLCERMLGGREEARDATQEVFLKAFRKASTYRPRGQVYTWLYRIAVNHCLNILRRRRVVRFFSFGDMGSPSSPARSGAAPSAGGGAGEPSFDPADEGPDSVRRLSAKGRWQATCNLIEGLPPGQRAVLVLVKLEGLSYRRAAQTLGISEGAVESRLFRAMQRLTRAQETGG